MEILKSRFMADFPSGALPPGTQGLQCWDFPFAGKERNGAGFYFVGGELLRVSVQPSPLMMIEIADQLKAKYGPPSTLPRSSDELVKLMRLPKHVVDICYDADTVCWRMQSITAGNLTAILIYTSHKLLDMQKRKADALRKDL